MTLSTPSVPRGRWAAMTAIGTVIGLVLIAAGYAAAVKIATAVMPVGGESFDSNPQADLAGYLWPVLSGLGLGLGVGSLQGRVFTKALGTGTTGRWIGATMVGGVVGFTLMSRLMDVLEGTLRTFLEPFFLEGNIIPLLIVALAAGMLVGLVVGAAQVTIGRVVTGIWPAISGVVWGSGFAAATMVLASRTYQETLGAMVLAAEPPGAGEVAGIAAVIAAVMALATGIASFILPPHLRPLSAR